MTSCPSFGHGKKYQDKTLFSRKFSLAPEKILTLYSPRPSLPTFSLMFITPLNFKCRTSTGYFLMTQSTKTSSMLFVFNSLMKCCHSNKKPNSGIVTWLMTHYLRSYMGRYFMANVVLLWSGSLLCIKLSKLWSFLKKYPKGFWEIFYDNHNLLL